MEFIIVIISFITFSIFGKFFMCVPFVATLHFIYEIETTTATHQLITLKVDEIICFLTLKSLLSFVNLI